MQQLDEKTRRYVMIDLAGQRFGMLTALEPLEERDQGRVVWRCRCDCGNIVYRYSSQLRKGVKTNCGCKSVRKLRNDLTGQKFGSLTVLGSTGQRDNGHIVWKCRCDCGKITMVQTQYLKDGSTKCCKSCQKENRHIKDITGQRFGILTALYPTEKRDCNQSVIWHCKCDCGKEVDCSCGDLQRKNHISCGCLKRKAVEHLKDRTTHVAGTTVELLKNKKVRSDNSTGVTGVNVYNGKYRAMIHFQGKRYYLGTYKTLEESAAARKEAEKSLYDEFLNFYDKWKQKAEADKRWGEENPVSFSVTRTKMGNFNIIMQPKLE